MEHAKNHTVYSMEEAVKKITVFKEEGAKDLIDGEDAVPVSGMDQFGSHFEGARHGIFCPAGRAKTAMAAERNIFKITAVRTGIHSPAKGRITTVDQFVNVVHFAVPGMEGIFNFFIIVSKDIL